MVCYKTKKIQLLLHGIEYVTLTIKKQTTGKAKTWKNDSRLLFNDLAFHR